MGGIAFVAGRLLATEHYGDAVTEHRIRIFRFKSFALVIPFAGNLIYK